MKAVNIEDLILLNQIDGLGFIRLKELLDVFQSTSAILKAGSDELLEVSGIDGTLADKIPALNKKGLSDELRLIKDAGVKLVSVFDSDYPENLRKIYSPPILLYVLGDMKREDSDAVAIVGTRQPSRYAVSMCEKIAYQLASMGMTIVSGFARGIDTTAHKGAVKAGRTIAVLGSGLNFVYPSENMGLVKGICEQGAVISEFAMNTSPYKANFPRRNRVICGLSLGVLVVEASKRSGSLITAGFALNENRELFAVPGQAGSARNEGSNNLIREGAKLVEGAEDIVVEIQNSLRHKKSGIARAGYVIKSDRVLTDEEKLVTGQLSDEPLYIDELVKKSGISPGRINRALLSLELKKVVRELPGKNFILQ
ncbi:MAG: DNA-protecting protein DprA [Candidatus Omnitrophica bacterium]|nr:DNA-protecting protein DprA [Candidatus Omnitrophota bacterium]